MQQSTIYWAGPLFTLAERLFNAQCAEQLTELGYKVILPQVEAHECLSDENQFNLRKVAKQCREQVLAADILVANLDGSDSDSGTSVEVGLMLGKKKLTGQGLAIGVRTDFRGHEADGVNAMFLLLDEIIYLPSHSTRIDILCERIDATIVKLMPRVPGG